jgi:succinylglutamate desuccinylase
MIISKDANIQGAVRIIAEKKGPHVVMFAGVHGDEVSGVHAIEKLLFDFFGGKRELIQGSLTLARVNEHALSAERRYVKHNMNRLFRDDYGPEIDRTGPHMSLLGHRNSKRFSKIATTSLTSIRHQLLKSHSWSLRQKRWSFLASLRYRGS